MIVFEFLLLQPSALRGHDLDLFVNGIGAVRLQHRITGVSRHQGRFDQQAILFSSALPKNNSGFPTVKPMGTRTVKTTYFLSSCRVRVRKTPGEAVK